MNGSLFAIQLSADLLQSCDIKPNLDAVELINDDPALPLTSVKHWRIHLNDFR